MASAKRNILVLPSWRDPRMIAGIGHYAREHQWHLALQYLMTPELPANWRGDGAILSEGGNPTYNSYLNEIARHTPTVTLGEHQFDTPCPSLHLDNPALGEMAAHYFLEKGHLNFVWYTSRQTSLDDQRGNGFREIIESAGHSCSMLCYPPAEKRKERTVNLRVIKNGLMATPNLSPIVLRPYK